MGIIRKCALLRYKKTLLSTHCVLYCNKFTEGGNTFWIYASSLWSDGECNLHAYMNRNWELRGNVHHFTTRKLLSTRSVLYCNTLTEPANTAWIYATALWSDGQVNGHANMNSKWKLRGNVHCHATKSLLSNHSALYWNTFSKPAKTVWIYATPLSSNAGMNLHAYMNGKWELSGNVDRYATKGDCSQIIVYSPAIHLQR